MALRSAGLSQDRRIGSVDPFDDRGDALADADAHGRQAIAAAALLHFMNQASS